MVSFLCINSRMVQGMT
uniref:Uncharacterized protein n=1 Tax=Arundo donax TaxID=35708 RepID=A0A0A9FXV2_ARUDO